MLHEFFHNFTHNLFKPLLLFFYLGFLLPILEVRFKVPYVIYQSLTVYLLLAIGWRGGEALAQANTSDIGRIAGFMVVGFVLNFAIGMIAYVLLNKLTTMRRIDKATVAGHYGSDGAGSFATCVGVLTSLDIAFDAFMPVMLAVMEIPGCLVALWLVSRLRRNGMDATGLLPDEPGYTASAAATEAELRATGQLADGVCLGTQHEGSAEKPSAFTSQKPEHSDQDDQHPTPPRGKKPRTSSCQLLQEALLNPGLGLLVGGTVIGIISGRQGTAAVHDYDTIFVSAFQGALCLFLLEMGMMASRKLRDIRSAGRGFIFFALAAPNVFATLGISVAHGYAFLTHTEFKPGTYALFAILCAAASYIAVPAVQRAAIPEASPTLPLAASLGLTMPYNVTIGIPIYIEITHLFN